MSRKAFREASFVPNCQRGTYASARVASNRSVPLARSDAGRPTKPHKPTRPRSLARRQGRLGHADLHERHASRSSLRPRRLACRCAVGAEKGRAAYRQHVRRIARESSKSRTNQRQFSRAPRASHFFHHQICSPANGARVCATGRNDSSGVRQDICSFKRACSVVHRFATTHCLLRVCADEALTPTFRRVSVSTCLATPAEWLVRLQPCRQVG
jgi:glucose/arabinose dehydrogenase